MRSWLFRPPPPAPLTLMYTCQVRSSASEATALRRYTNIIIIIIIIFRFIFGWKAESIIGLIQYYTASWVG